MQSVSEVDSSDSRDLAYCLIASLMNGAIRACIDSVGYSNAFKALVPSIRHNADWCLSNSKMLTGHMPQTIEGLLEMMNWTMNMANRGNITYWTTANGELLIENEGCRTCGKLPELCDWWCQYEFSMMCDDSNPDMIMSLERSISKGDDVCLWSIKRKDKIGLSIKCTKPTVMIYSVNSIDKLDFWAMAGTAEGFAQSTACLVQMVGREKAVQLLTQRAREAGNWFGVYLRSKMEIDSRNKEDTWSILMKINSMLGIEPGIVRRTEKEVEMKVASCPFSGVSPEVCIQIEEFKKEALRVLFPESDWNLRETHIEDGSCSISMAMKSSHNNGETHSTNPAVFRRELTAVLQMRLAKGEISESEYDRLIEKLTNNK